MIKTFFPWYGGKHRMASDLISFIPRKTDIYVEVFGGGARVLFNKSLSPLEVYNDLDMGLVSIFNCMKDVGIAKELQRLLLETPYSQEVFLEALEHYDDLYISTIERARYKWILITQSFNSACNSWKVPKTPNVISTYERRIINMIDFVPRIKMVEIENLDFKELIDKYDSPDTFFYLDPPYVLDTRGAKDVYKHEGDDNLHIHLVKKLLNIEGRFLLSGYEHPLYDKLSSGNCTKTKLGDYAKSSQKTSKGSTKSKGCEYIWRNY